MTALLVLLCGVFGAAIGSFLNVVIWRVPRGESIVRPASHCPSCDAGIAARDNVPVISWLVLGGRCRGCGGRISARYPLVEAITAGIFAALAAKFGGHAVLPAYLYFGAIAVTLALIDLDTFRLPNVIVLPSYLAGGALLGIAAGVEHDGAAVVRGLLGMAVYYGAFFVLWFAYPRGMGFGDVKLAGVLGLFLGYLGWGILAVGAFAGVLLGGIVGIGLVLFAGAGRKTRVPYGPFMLTGALLAIFAGASIAHAYTHAAGV